MSHYQITISAKLETVGLAGRYDPRHIEAYMRLEHATLDALTLKAFHREIVICVDAIDAGGVDAAEDLATSYGL